jgi:hypothetical protein
MIVIRKKFTIMCVSISIHMYVDVFQKFKNETPTFSMSVGSDKGD